MEDRYISKWLEFVSERGARLEDYFSRGRSASRFSSAREISKSSSFRKSAI